MGFKWNTNQTARCVRLKRKKETRPRQQSRRVWKYGLLSLALLSIGVGGFALYEYEHLQPGKHFRNLPVLGVNQPAVSSTPTVAPENTTSAPAGSTVGNTSSLSAPSSSGHVLTLPPGVVNVLLIGSDKRKGDTAGHSDSMLIVHVDLRTHQFNVVSIPRDTRVYLVGYGYTKLTSVQYIGQATQGTVRGILDAIQSVTALTGVPINYYAETDYWGLQDIVDSMGGINMYVPFNMTLTHPWYGQDGGKFISQGDHFFNGRMVTEVVHERYSVPGIDYGRQQLQEEAMIGIAKTLLTPTSITKIPAFLRQLPNYLVATNMSVSDMLSLALANQHFQASDVHYYQIPGTSEIRYDDILQANNDELILNTADMKKIISAHFS